ncbi:MAG: hypothetical protein R3200_15970 [Xanthomonadales bacterium]|nr:hypothetical protein [Xanthomonadales bacterium]
MTFPTRAGVARALGVIALFLTAIAVAQPMAQPAEEPSAEQNAAMQQLQAMQQKMQNLSSELESIQMQALEEHPELQQQQEDFRELLVDTMSEQGYEAEAAMERMMSMQDQLRSGELTEAEQQSMTTELQQESMNFQAAQGQAMQDEALQTALNELQSEMQVAMIETDPRTEDLLAQLNATQQEFQQLVQQLQGSQ